MKEKMPLVTSDDYGKDEASAKALLSRHNRLEGEIKAFGSEIKRLDELTQLMTKAASEHNVSPRKGYKRRMVVVLNFFEFKIYFFFALLVLYLP